MLVFLFVLKEKNREDLAARGIITQDPDQRRRDWQQSFRALETNVNSHTTQQAIISRSQNAAAEKHKDQLNETRKIDKKVPLRPKVNCY